MVECPITKCLNNDGGRCTRDIVTLVVAVDSRTNGHPSLTCDNFTTTRPEKLGEEQDGKV